jgi:hypothetical protein
MIVNKKLGTESTEKGEEDPQTAASPALRLSQPQLRVTALNATRKEPPLPTINEVQYVYYGSNRYRVGNEGAL